LVRQRILYYFLNKKKSCSIKEGEYVGFDKVKRVAILIDYNPVNEKQLRNFMANLNDMKISCKIASYAPGKIESIFREDFVYFRDSDFNIMGVSKDASLDRFLEQEYDVLFDLRDKDNIVSSYIHSSIKRKFSVGNSSCIEGNDIYINTANDISLFLNNIINYLQNLKKI
jgi:hypothetical protein